MLVAPETARRVAQVGLATRERVHAGGTARAVEVALKIAGGAELDLDDLRTIAETDRTHPVTAALVGGPEGQRWASTILARAEQAQTAAATPAERVRARLNRLNRTLARIDADLRAQLTAAADTALRSALRAAGVKLKMKAANRRAKGVVALDAPDLVAALAEGRATPRLCAVVGVTERELVAGHFDAFGDAADGLIANAQRRRRRAVARLANRPADDLDDEWEEAETEHRRAAVDLLVGGMLLVAFDRLVEPEPIYPDQGEIPAVPNVPPGLVSQAVRATNGAAVVTSPGVLPTPAPLSVVGSPAEDGPNPLVAEVVAEVAPEALVRQLWMHGDPARPFEPHLELDGWLSEDGGITWYPPDGTAADDGVTKPADEWPWTDTWYPQDHPGCDCSVTSDFDVPEFANAQGAE